MPITAEQKAQTIKDYAKFEGDTGSTEVQIALLTARINALSAHLTANKKDKHGQRGLQLMVGQRNRLTRYLRDKDFDSYRALIERLGLRR
ncbi:MAG TPA: 30S ribosomal protein S15 [Deinococcales bacterium]|nr:30S ribosomal protein S15 [Deinococcales bacterium]